MIFMTYIWPTHPRGLPVSVYIHTRFKLTNPETRVLQPSCSLHLRFNLLEMLLAPVDWIKHSNQTEIFVNWSLLGAIDLGLL